MTAVQGVIAGTFSAIGHPWLYLVLWVLPYFTLWRVINRLRSIAEHGGLRADKDRRITTHTIAQHRLARFYLVPYSIGFHLAHHVDAGVPFRNLARYHQLLRDAHYIDDVTEYSSYPALWRTISAAN
jgi:fatty acid desaturase